MKKLTITFLCMLCIAFSAKAQIKYYQNGLLTVGATEPFRTYYTMVTNGFYLKGKDPNFFQIDVTPAATRLASHGDQVVFYNSQTSTFNSIQVKDVYNYSDARAKTDLIPLSSCLSKIMLLKPYSYKFINESVEENKTFVKGGDAREYGLLAQDVEKVFPNLVITDPEGKKLINYAGLIPALLNAIQDLSIQVDSLKAKK